MALTTVQTNEYLAAAETCSVTGCCHAVLMADCSTLWDRGRRSCADPPKSVLLAGRHIQLMLTAVEGVLERSPPACRIPSDTWKCNAVDAFPHDRSLDKKLSYPQRKRASNMAVLYSAEGISISNRLGAYHECDRQSENALAVSLQL